ncbi:hypothetical protein K9M74_04355 [Candidatus Woesearchaeota archaeon]|nr:hypothetical protein [Candidatus Woesearchaeota archaeon]
MSIAGIGLEFISRAKANKEYLRMRGFEERYLFPSCCDNINQVQEYTAKKILIKNSQEFLVTNISILDALNDIKKYVSILEAMQSDVKSAENGFPSNEELQVRTDNYFSQKLNRKKEL